MDLVIVAAGTTDFTDFTDLTDEELGLDVSGTWGADRVK